MKLYKLFAKNKTTLLKLVKKEKIFLYEPTGAFLSQNSLSTKLENILSKHYKKLKIYEMTDENEKLLNVDKDGFIVYLDFPGSENLESAKSIDYDLRVLLGKDETAEGVLHKIIDLLERDQEYVSTRGSNEHYTFFDVIRDGLAKDRGLFVPKYFPRLENSQWERLVNLNYQERCLRILESFPLGTLKPLELFKMINEAYSTFINDSILPVEHLEKNQYLMQEFYGPSASFKDLALQLFPRLFLESVRNYNHKMAILVATSGDTGSAVLSGFKEIGIPVIVLYPHGKVSQIQEAQMITAEGNVSVLGVQGDFDFCQTAVKDIFNDMKFTDHLKKENNLNLTSANSINWGRLLPQICYSINSYLELVREQKINFGDKVDVCIPSGNFGNILGAFIAKRMGLPLDKLICASNENNILTDFLTTGEFDLRNRNLKETISPAIDILLPSNIERLLFFLTNDSEKVKSLYDQLQKEKYFKINNKLRYAIISDFLSGYCDQDECERTISDVYSRTGFIIDPHTAVAKNIADRYSTTRTNPILIASTAHYAKFPETVIKALNITNLTNLKDNLNLIKSLNSKSKFHDNLDNVLEKEVIHKTVLDSDVEAIKNQIKNNIRAMKL